MSDLLSIAELLEKNLNYYDIVVIGGGHAGIEASLAPARIGLKTLMICGDFNKVGNMPCNPSIGGPAKGILVRELDALGGQMGKSADATAIQFKMLNLSKGPAVWALRVQSDKLAYARFMQEVCLNQVNLDIYEGLVDSLITDSNQVKGVILENEIKIYSKAVIVTTGTYLSSAVICGDDSHPAGPDEEKTNYGLSKSLSSIGFHLLRLKTGTPPRVYTDTIDFSKLQLEPGTNEPLSFSYDSDKTLLRPFNKQVPCYLIWTNKETHKIIQDHMKECSMYSGLIKGVGPRYCPSIETKLVRFADKERHQLFLEPESLIQEETYLQGFSTSMPHDIQDKMVKSLDGFKLAVIAKYAYAIEYDAIDPLELKPTLETKKIQGLYFGGQVNGTSGYEEAAVQGLMAGINASCQIKNEPQLVLRRDEAYIGVLIDDLVTKGVIDPYRMLTSRAEYRLLLRHDNCDQRLTKYGFEVGLISQERYNKFINKTLLLDKEKARLEVLHITPTKEVNEYLVNHSSPILNEGITGTDLMKRPEITYLDIVNMTGLESPVSLDLGHQLDIEIKYKGYIDKAYKDAKKALKLESIKLGEDFNYDEVLNLASEAKEKLKMIKPLTIAQANRISGVNPSDISILLIFIEARRRKNGQH